MDAVTAFEHREDALRAQLEKAQDMQAGLQVQPATALKLL